MRTNICDISGKSFVVSNDDLAFYAKMGVPEPKLCPEERARRRLAWRNERVLSRRTCDKTGKGIVSIHSGDKPYPVWDNEVWWADDWDARAYARPFDFSRSFFEQFHELYAVVPQQAAQHAKSENCDYTNQSQCNKDCYLVVATNFSRDCLYGMWFQQCEDCVDCLYLEKSQLCYEVINGTNCYECTFSQNLENCSQLHFCKNCIGCRNCVGCVNLRNKEFCFFGEQLSKEQYFQRLEELNLDSHSGLARAQALSEEQISLAQHKYYVGRLAENSSGDYLQEVRNAIDSYNCRHAEDISYCRDAWQARNCYDMLETLENDFCIELEGCWQTNDCGFSMKLNQAHNVWYSSHCFSSDNLFACVGLRRARHCILNQQYSEEDYQHTRQKIIEHMKDTGEWGEFFPARDSFFAYNETVAQEYFPLEKSEAEALGCSWRQFDSPTQSNRTPANEAPENRALLNETPLNDATAVPDTIAEVSDKVLEEQFVCRESQRPYRITAAELKFYRKIKVPLPQYNPWVRHIRRMNKRNPRRLQEISCSNCNIKLQSTFSADTQLKVNCEECYQTLIS